MSGECKKKTQAVTIWWNVVLDLAPMMISGLTNTNQSSKFKDWILWWQVKAWEWSDLVWNPWQLHGWDEIYRLVGN